ncbi:MAG: hypothetical protein V4506_04110 [Bacteroidota bacterium]
MKALFFIIALSIAGPGVAQVKQNASIKITKAKFTKAKKLTNLIPPVKGCTITAYHFSTNMGNTVKSFDVKGGDITATMKALVKDVKKGEKVTIDNIKSNCDTEYKRKYIFVIN